MELNKILLNPGADIYYDPKFRIILEDHMTYLKNLASTKTVEIDMNRSYKYEGDFYGLLYDMGISPYLHFIILRMNDLTSPANYNNQIRQLIIPEGTEINRLRSAYKVKNKT